MLKHLKTSLCLNNYARMGQRLLREFGELVTRKRFPGSNPGPGVSIICDKEVTLNTSWRD